ncbi:MAG: VanW family protein [Clostridia bacterium]|nr:VanW family protein [Clostridia bacterium]
MYNQGYRPDGQQPSGQAYSTQANWYAPPPQPKAPKGKRTRQSEKPKNKKRSLKWQLVKLLLVLVLFAAAAAGAYYWKLKSDVEPYQNVFLDNVSVDGIDLSGKTWAEGSQLVWNQIQQKQNGWYIRLRNARGDYKDITAATLGISFDPTAALEHAWAIGHDSSMNLLQLQNEIELAKMGSNSFSSAEQSADLTPIDTILSTLEAAAYRAPSDAYIISFNPDDSANPFTYQQEVYGQRLNTSAIREQILTMVQNLQSGEILLQTELIYPSVTVEQLSQTVALRARAVTPIADNSSADRTENIRIAFSKFNGMQLEDGKRFSFNKVVGKRNFDTGFLPAIEYAYGLEQWGWGGGVCQASTTLYLAAAQSGMTILEREPHSMSVSYTELGLDATVSDTRGREIDFSFRNQCGGTVYIAAHVIKSPTNRKKLLCEVRIYGPSMGDVRYELEAQTTEVIPKPVDPIMKEDKDGDYVTYIDETKTIKGRDGYVVESYLATYTGDVCIDRKKMYTDTYPAKADTIYTGTQFRTGN